MATIKIGEAEIYNRGDAVHGLDHLASMPHEEVQELLAGARRESDRDVNFTANINGHMYNYTLIHTGYDKYELRWKA